MAYAYQNLLNFENTPSGIAEQVLLAPVFWFAAGGIKSLPVNSNDVVITASHQFATSAYGFITFQLAPEKNNYDAKTVGERGSQKLEHELKIFVPGSYQQAHEAVKIFLNEPLIVLQRDGNCSSNLYYQFGCWCDYAYLKVDFSTGTTKDGTKGYTGTITYISESIELYAGTIKKI